MQNLPGNAAPTGAYRAPATPTPATVHTAPTLTGAALAWVEHNRAMATARRTAMQAQAAELRTSIRAKLTARANAGDPDAVLYMLAQGW